MMHVNWCTFFFSVLVAPLISSVSGLTPSKLEFSPKNIHISSTGGGISHIAWTLEIGKVLADRGHNVSFSTSDMYIKFGLPYEPHIKTISMGPHLSKIQFRDLFDTEDPISTGVTNAYVTLIGDIYKRDYFVYRDIFTSSNTSLVICDQLSLPCFDAAKALDIPMVVHMTMSLSQGKPSNTKQNKTKHICNCTSDSFIIIDTRAPFITLSNLAAESTTLNQSLKQRLYQRYVLFPRFVYRYRPIAMAIKKARQEINVEDFDPLSRHSNVIKMINSFWGMDSPRPIGPLVEYVGPIIGTTYDSLPEDLLQFMEQNQRVVYIAFGQMYNPNKQEFHVLLTSLMEAYELNYFDGFIWSLSAKSRQDLPEQIQTRSGKTYSVHELLYGNQYPNIRFESWAPQFAILDHANCKLFISHGGASSIHESLYNGVPLLLHPFTSDQPSNADNMAQAGVALVLNRKKYNITDTFEKLSTILLDKDGRFALNMKSMQALVQLKSRRKFHAADMIEEILYSVRNQSDIWNRREVAANMPWYKATNWDVDLCAFGGLIVFIMILPKILYNAFALLRFIFVSPKKWKMA
jgi:UDP-N-acetylglucosamine:LPS N-acetylglucosamine transferase